MIDSNFFKIVPPSFSKLPKVQPMNFDLEYQLFETHNIQKKLPTLLPEIQTLSIAGDPGTEPNSSEQVIKSFLTGNSLLFPPDFKLSLESQLETTLYKGKYFSFKVSLDQLSGAAFPVSESLELEVRVYNEENTVILKNMHGTDILRGNHIQNMHFNKAENKHVAQFKVQITEVSSHFIGKSLKLKIKSRKTEFISQSGWKIKPIWIENVVVKAKKLN